MSDALPATSLSVFPGLGQAPMHYIYWIAYPVAIGGEHIIFVPQG